jgi:hypothetical protein
MTATTPQGQTTKWKGELTLGLPVTGTAPYTVRNTWRWDSWVSVLTTFASGRSEALNVKLISGSFDPASTVLGATGVGPVERHYFEGGIAHASYDAGGSLLTSWRSEISKSDAFVRLPGAAVPMQGSLVVEPQNAPGSFKPDRFLPRPSVLKMQVHPNAVTLNADVDGNGIPETHATVPTTSFFQRPPTQ